MLKLYYSPLAVSLVSHIALEELELPYVLEKISVRGVDHLTPAYRRIHPLSRVPALEIEPGQVLTETPALLWYLSALAPERGLLPTSNLEAARANEWMSLCSSAVHIAFISFFRPSRFLDDEAGAAALRRDGKARFCDLLRHVESRLPEDGFALGERYSLCDPYLLVFHLWARKLDLPVAELSRYSHLASRVLLRPAVRRALEQEGIGTLDAVTPGNG
jgi:glutathione S-transferase